MCATCHGCGSEAIAMDYGGRSQGIRDCSNVDSRDPMNCKFCVEKKEQDSTRMDVLSPCTTPAISPTTSLSCSDSSVSIYSDFSVDINLFDRYYRGNQEEATVSTSDEDAGSGVNGQFSDSRVEDAYVNGLYGPPNRAIEEKGEEFGKGSSGDIARDIDIMPGSDLSVMNDPGGGGNSYAFGDEMENWTWEPPEPENPENDVQPSLVGDDHDKDDDECVDDTQWGQPSYPSALESLDRRNYRYNKEKKRAINEVINGKFKALVRQLLDSFGVPLSEDGDESWVNIVTSLSWEAASFLKPDVADGKTIDPDSHVKIKCIATGTRSQSQFVKGLVFKKRAAHEHMPTMYKYPKLLLIKGMVGQSSSGLSSFDSMKQEKNGYLKFIIDMIETFNPHVILVEKFVSRDVQEYILAKGITLVFDTKLHRLERIALCTGSFIFSADKLNIQKLKCCDSFRIEKFVEEHTGLGEGGKRQGKTLMFLEGCPLRLGCTILLKGSHSDELKRIKSVMQCSVVLAYHLILETSFAVDQRTMFFTIPSSMTNITQSNQPTQTSDGIDTSDSSSGQPPLKEHTAVDIPISDGFCGGGDPAESAGSSPFFDEPYNPVVLSGFSSLSASLKRVLGDSLPPSTNYPSMPEFFGSSEKDADSHLDSEDSLRANSEMTKKSDGDIDVNLDNPKPCDEQAKSLMASSKAYDRDREHGDPVSSPSKIKDRMMAVLDAQSILVLMSRCNALRGRMCEQSHFSLITFYKNSDVPLGKFLRENVLNQRSQCITCSEQPEAHCYYYAHQNEKLTIQVKRLPMSKCLAGEREGKLWMWSCCSKCKPGSRAKASTKRILLSSTARRLSFGKFLELSFAHQSSAMRTGICGHSLQKDYLYFFGFGPLVAIFKYCPVTTYTVSMPPQRLEFHRTVESDLLKNETGRVYMKGKQLFSELQSSLKKIGAKISSSIPLDQGASMELLVMQEMLQEENHGFELKMQNVLNIEYPREGDYKFLTLNRIQWELYIESVIWDRRLHSPRLPDRSYVTSKNPRLNQSESESGICGSSSGNEGADLGSKNEVPGGDFNKDILTEPETNMKQEELEVDKSSLPDHLRVKTAIQRTSNLSISDAVINSSGSQGLVEPRSVQPNSQSFDAWIWKSFSEIQEMHVSELQRGCSRKYEPSSGRTAKVSPTGLQLISEEGSRLHIPLDNDAYMVSDFEGELSSIIACALALLKDQPAVAELKIDDSRLDTGVAIRGAECLRNLIRFPSMSSTHSSSSGSFDSDLLNSPNSVFSEESHLSRFNRLVSLDSSLPSETLKAEVSLGVAKSLVKGKYSVVCLYADQFRDLRNMCCSSENDFIMSLSRCRDWDAKGGKSKSFFSKTLDDRLIIKEIKKTEFDSFEKFAPHYFKHMKESLESGNHTCLAKVLGIYQLTIRKLNAGKEVSHDLMVMENLSFGRKITRQYDLKGALLARFTAAAADGTGDVLLDQNFVNDMNSSPLYVSNKEKNVLQLAVWNDTRFLDLINVMDYSLLVGVDGEKQELVCGIIDYLRQYTWDKKLETWVKSSLNTRKNVLPTVISPKEYKKRFRKFMSAHFRCVPDDWCPRNSSNACEIDSVNRDSTQPATEEASQTDPEKVRAE